MASRQYALVLNFHGKTHDIPAHAFEMSVIVMSNDVFLPMGIGLRARTNALKEVCERTTRISIPPQFEAEAIESTFKRAPKRHGRRAAV